jgi:superfamily II DNA/RNA helicase
VTYTHRLGRTGRAGRSGEGLVVLLPFEKKLVNGLRRNGIEENASLDASDSSFVITSA